MNTEEPELRLLSEVQSKWINTLVFHSTVLI